mgnify:CR=1 FL=1
MENGMKINALTATMTLDHVLQEEAIRRFIALDGWAFPASGMEIEPKGELLPVTFRVVPLTGPTLADPCLASAAPKRPTVEIGPTAAGLLLRKMRAIHPDIGSVSEEEREHWRALIEAMETLVVSGSTPSP